ncbi:uncharacterized protein LOC130050568 [Ostrea edulis]|uniref:uncharacterized protein LOC130050568 n=1 Tax=Ostrea edulis TaxID=37623 RepID=UPI0024AF183F|nr:uncharacterized protein LOC130050568 [Ostrea edulis]
MKLIVIWEHEYDKMIREETDAKAFVDSLELVERLDPRGSLMGGRTTGFVLYKSATQGTKIKYVDFTSLYPYVNKTARYLIGHPEIITRDFDNMSTYFGIDKVKVLPPRDLFHPVLGYRIQGKITFPFCRKCAEFQKHDLCQCSDAARALTGTYCTPELLKANEKGYKILKIYEIYQCRETTQYDSSVKTGGLFTPYINMLLKIKQEASGRPTWVKTDKDLCRYIAIYEQKEGIRLNPDNIEYNPRLRSLAKLLLNSFWGKFSQRMNLCKTQILHDSQAHVLLEQMANPTIQIQDFNIVDDNHLMLSTKHISENMCDPGHTNVFFASFNTCWARLKLYELLDLLQIRVLYWDTDSVICTQKEGELQICHRGLSLGTHERVKRGRLDNRVYLLRSQNYAYKTFKGKEVCKVKGFSLNYINSSIINLASMKDAMFNRKDSMTGNYHTVNPNKICREKIHSELYCQEEVKRYAAVYTKRVVQPNLTTLPCGF